MKKKVTITAVVIICIFVAAHARWQTARVPCQI